MSVRASWTRLISSIASRPKSRSFPQYENSPCFESASRSTYASGRMHKKLYLETFGCQMNVLDSELVLGQLRAQGYESVTQRDDADVVVYNTCSVREHAEQKVWSRLGELREVKKLRPNLVIGVIGCMAEREGTS